MTNWLQRKAQNQREWERERAACGEPQLFIWPSRRAGDHTPFQAEIALRRVTWRGEAMVLAQVRDLSEQRQADLSMRENERQLQKDRVLLQSLVNGTPTLIAALDPQMRLIVINPAFARTLETIYGLTPRLYQSLEEFLAEQPELMHTLKPLWERAVLGESYTTSAALPTPGGEERIFNMRFNPIHNSEGEVIGAAHVTTEVPVPCSRDERLPYQTCTRR